MSTVSPSTSALSSLLSSLNNGNSGIDVTSAVASIIYAERAPERAFQDRQTALNTQAAALQQIETQASSLTTSLQSLGDVGGALSNAAVTSSNSTLVSATAAPGTVSGTHTVTVSSLATIGSAYSATQASSSSTLAPGSFSITVGGASTTFTTGSGVDTLDQLAAAVNSSGLAVSASVITDANGARLALRAQSSGSAADFSVSTGGAGGLTFTKPIDGANASFTVDGVSLSSASNTVTGAVAGLTLALQAITPGSSSVTVAISPDNTAITTAVNNFVSSYNTLIKNLNSQFTYNALTTSEGVLGTDSTARSLQLDVLGAANTSAGSNALPSLASLGIATQKDGTLTLDSAALNAALSSNYQGVVQFFQGSTSGSTTTPGFATNFVTTLDRYTNGTQGAFTVDLKSISNEYQDLGTRIDNFERYITSQQTLLTKQYNDANIALQQLPQQIKQIQTILGTNSSSGK